MMIWKGPWDSAIQYAQNDVVEYNGSSYIAVASAPPIGQPPVSSQDWNLVAQAGSPGLVWRGIWQDGSYQVGDAVSYQGSSYIAISMVQKGNPPPPQSLDKWQLLAAEGLMGITWRGDWDSQTIYQLNDAVRYNNGTYASLIDNNQNHQPTDEHYWQNITQDAEAQAANLASIIISSVSALTAIVSAIIAFKNAISTGINQATNLANQAINTANQAANTANQATNTANQIGNAAGGAFDRIGDAITQITDVVEQLANRIKL